MRLHEVERPTVAPGTRKEVISERASLISTEKRACVRGSTLARQPLPLTTKPGVQNDSGMYARCQGYTLRRCWGNTQRPRCATGSGLMMPRWAHSPAAS